MIVQHEFNSAWWGAPVGIVKDSEFFGLSKGEQDRLTAGYAWAEFRTSAPDLLTRNRLAHCGWIHVDTEIPFCVRLTPSLLTGDAAALDLATYLPDEEAALEDLAEFASERYALIPGMSPRRLNARYAAWGLSVIRRSPATCFRISYEGQPQGYFLSEPGGRGLHLVLAGRYASSRVSGSLIYQRALAEYAALGYRLGWASFSASNTAVLNIYAACGARFNAPQEHYMWFGSGEGSGISGAGAAGPTA